MSNFIRCGFFLFIAFTFNFSTLTIRPAQAVVTELVRENGGVNVPFDRLYLGTQNIIVIPGNNNGDSISSIHWTATATLNDCSRNFDFGFGNQLTLNLPSLGTFAIKAEISYQDKSTDPPTPVASNVVRGVITIYPPSGFRLYTPDQSLSFSFLDDPNDPSYTTIHFQLLRDGTIPAAGYNMNIEEMIAVSVPNGAPDPFMGGWALGGQGNAAGTLTMNSDGYISDIKAYHPDDAPNIGLGQILYQYKQTIGIRYDDWCGNPHDVALGTVTVTQSRHPTIFTRWTLTVTQP